MAAREGPENTRFGPEVNVGRWALQTIAAGRFRVRWQDSYNGGHRKSCYNDRNKNLGIGMPMSAVSARRLLAGVFLFVFLLVSPVICAAGAPPPLEVYGALPNTEAVALSPDGTMIAMVNTEGEKRLLSIRKIDGGVIAKALVGETKLAGLEWAGNDYLLFYGRQTAALDHDVEHKQEFVQGVVISVKSGEMKTLLRSSESYLEAIFGRFGYAQQDGRWYGYYGLIPTRADSHLSDSGDFQQRYRDLYRVDLETQHVELVEHGSARSRDWLLDAHGQVVVESEYDSGTGNWRVFLPHSVDKAIAGGHSRFSFDLEGFSRTADTVLLDNPTDDEDVAELRLDTGKLEHFLPANKATAFIRSPTSKLLIGAVLVDDNQSMIFDPILDRRLKSIGKAFRDHTMRLTSVSADMSRIIVHVSGKDSAGVWQLVDFTTGKATPVAEDYPDIPDATIGSVQMVDYHAADGTSLQGVLTLPPNLPAHNLPLIALPHGGPEARDRIDFDWWAQAFAARGYAVFQPNFRGSSGYGEAFRDAGFGQWGRKMQTDISDGVVELANRGIVDSRRVCIVGASYGGYAALAGVTLQHGLYRSSASYGGVSDMHSMLYTLANSDRGDLYHYSDPEMRYWLSYLGFNSANNNGLDAVSPQAQAKQADAPILLIYGENDTVVPPDQSRHMASALRAAEKTVELVKLDGEDHWLSKSNSRRQMLKAMVTFVEKYNPADPPQAH
jgi:dipeptidyl aminopeptidase/acylaminoacyl peptidase